MDLSKYTTSNTPTFGLAGMTYTARLVDVHDGDTVTVIAEVFPSVVFKFHVRLVGIDSPEMTSKTPAVKDLAERARLRLVSLLTGGTVVLPHGGHLTRTEMMNLLQKQVHLVSVRCQNMDKYGRVLAEVSQGESLQHAGLVLLQEGLARPYAGGTKDVFEPVTQIG